MIEKKVILVGSGGAGKTAFLSKLINQTFSEQYQPTIGVNVIKYIRDDVIINFWDVAGVENNAGLRDGYYAGADVVIFFADLTNPDSFKNISKYARDVFRATNHSISRIFIGTKLDINDKKKMFARFFRSISKLKYNDDNNFETFSISSKTGYNIPEVIEHLMIILNLK